MCIASGSAPYMALPRRIDSKKVKAGVSTMHLLYRSSSLANTTELERRLIIRFQDVMADGRVWNSAAGCGGRHGAGPNYYVYLAVTQ